MKYKYNNKRWMTQEFLPDYYCQYDEDEDYEDYEDEDYEDEDE